LSDSNGTIYDKDGICAEKLAWVMELKNGRRGRIQEYVKQYPGAEYLANRKPWHIPAQCAFPSATQNEIDGEDAKELVKNGCYVVGEGANMPTTPEGVDHFLAAKILYGPGKAANAGGVATSGLEMAQNSMRICWSREEVDGRLRGIMASIHEAAFETAKEYGHPGDYVMGANIAGFVKVADAMLAQGLV
jgi:glutamate dehydrogenase (NADP+)